MNRATKITVTVDGLIGWPAQAEIIGQCVKALGPVGAVRVSVSDNTWTIELRPPAPEKKP